MSSTNSSAKTREFTLSDSETGSREESWSICSSDLGISAASPFAVSKRILHGGKQEGVELVEVDNGTMKCSIIPTRGMSMFKVTSGDVTLGWPSPVNEIVNPAFIELESRPTERKPLAQRFWKIIFSIPLTNSAGDTWLPQAWGDRILAP
jgi:hypothetical protein